MNRKIPAGTLLALCALVLVTGCGIVVQVQPPAPGGAAGVSGGPTPGGPPPSQPTSSPPPATGSPEPGSNLPQPGATTSPPPSPTPTPSGTAGALVPPAGASSGGKGGQAPLQGATQQAGNVRYNLIVPTSYSGNPTPLLICYSGIEGAQAMTSNLLNLGRVVGAGDLIMAILDGKTYYGDGQAGVTVLDDVRAKYNVDNDRTYLLSESAGTSAGLKLGFHLRQSYFAAYWANDVNNVDVPETVASQLGFAPWGQVGPGGQTQAAQSIVDGMRKYGYRLPEQAPYAGAGSNQHGNPQQFIEALRFFPGKTRQ